MSNVIPAWASTPNYPPGASPWSGLPTKVTPAYTFFTPGQTPSAQELNSMFNVRDVALNSVGNTGGEIAAANFGALQTLGNDGGGHTFQIYAICYDHIVEQWLIAIDGSVGGTPAIWSSQDGTVWKAITTMGALPNSAVVPKAMAAYPGTGTVALYGDTGVNGIITRCTQAAGAPAPVGTTNNAWAIRSAALCQQGIMEYFWGANTPAMYFIGASRFGTRGPWIGFAATDSNDGSGAAGVWTDAHASLPASFLTGNSLIYKWMVCQSSNTMLVGLSGQLVATDPSLLLKIDATGAMSDVTPAFIGSSLAIRGIAYSATDALWGMIATDGTTTILYASADLISWTAITGTSGVGNGLAVIGSAWVMNVSSFGGFTSTDKTFYFTNVAQVFATGATIAARSSSWPTIANLAGNTIPVDLRSSEVPPGGIAVHAPQFAVVTLNSNNNAGANFAWQSLKAGHVPTVGASGLAPTPQLGWNTALDVDFSKFPTTTYGADGPISLGGYTWTKSATANDRAPLTNNNGTGLVWAPTAGNTSSRIYLPLTAFIPANVLLWSTAIRIWVYVQAQNFAHNADQVECYLATSTGTAWYEGIYGVNGANKAVLTAVTLVNSTTGFETLANAPGAATNVFVIETPSIDSGVARYLSGTYNTSQFPTEASALFQAVTADGGTGIWQDPSASPVGLTGIGLALDTHANAATAALSVTVGRVRVDYKI